MLAELCAYARGDQRIAGTPGFQLVRVDWLITIGMEGDLIGFESTKELDGRRAVARRYEIPQRGNRTVNVDPEMLVDKLAYVLGGKQRKDRERHAAYITRTRQIAEATKDEGLRAQVRFLDRWDHGEFRGKFPQDAKGTDLFGFQLHPSGELLFTPDRPSVLAYVRRVNKTVGESAQCLVCGGMCAPKRLHFKIKRLPGSTQASLVSANERSFESFGFGQGDNSPVCNTCVEQYTKALNSMLLDRRSRFTLDESSVFVFWSTGQPPIDVVDLLDANPDAVRVLLESPLRGKRPAEIDQARFYLALLSSNHGRAVVRSWIDQSLPATFDSLRMHFRDVAIVAGGAVRVYPLRRLFGSLLSERSHQQALPSSLEEALLRATFVGSPYPPEILQLAVIRLRAGARRAASPELMALIKATLRRLPEPQAWKGDATMDATNKDPAYLCGRLFALLERAQRSAIGEANASITDRYYGAASATPAAVFGALLRLSQHHLEKSSSGQWLKAQIGGVIDLLPPAFPATLSIRDQGVFAIGYYQQREALFDRKPEEKET